jgi:predicted nucleotide-binding protein
MSTTHASLLAEVVACRHIVEDYTKRLDDACVEYYQTGTRDFPNLSRAEEEDTYQQCELVLTRLAPIMPEAMSRWKSIKYPSDQYHEMIERMRDSWIRRRNLFRVLENTLRTNLELDRLAEPRVTGRKAMIQPNGNRALIIHGHDERNMLALKDLLHSKLQLPEPVIMAQQMVPGASLPEKFERLAASMGFAVALLTPDDVGRASAGVELKPRPRQSTLVEIAWFWGRLGRDRVLLLVKEELELPSDLQGVEYHRFRSGVEEVSEKVRDFFEAHRSVEGGA